jgi:hypothetical protein
MSKTNSKIERRPIDFTSSGRMISGSKRAPEGHVCVFNANVCLRSEGKIWFGDLDLTTDAEDLKRLAAEKGEDVYVLRERDARFTNEAAPLFGEAVARYTPTGEVVSADPRLAA